MSYIVTINREHGSGGRLIGKAVAEKLGIPFYDEELITKTADKSGFAEDFVRETGEKKTVSLLYSLYMTSMPISDQLFLAQSQVIKDIATEGSAVIIGRCADYVLREHPHCYNVFVHAPFETRMARVRDEYKEANGEDVRAYLQKKDKNRSSYYNYFTQYKWASARNYDLCIDSSIGTAATADIIAMTIEQYKKTF